MHYRAEKQQKKLNEAFIQAFLVTLKEKTSQEKEDYTENKFIIAVLEQDLYKIYEQSVVFIVLGLKSKDALTTTLTELEKNKATLDSEQTALLQLIKNWKEVEPILKKEQEKRQALKKLEKAKQA